MSGLMPLRLKLTASESLETRRLMSSFYVDTNNPVASDSNSGTITRPLKTISQALNLASDNNAVSQADSIIIRGGVYHEQPNIWTGDSGTSTSRTLITAYFNTSSGAYEPVYIDAADPTTGTWIEDGTSSRWYLSNFHTETSGVWVDWSATNDGASLQQIGGYNETSADRKIVGSTVSDMYPGTYFGDSADSRLYVWLADGSNPNLHTLEYANRARAIYEPGTPLTGGGYSYGNHIDFQQLKLRHDNIYDTVGQDTGCAMFTEGDQRLINLDIQWNAGVGVFLRGTSQMISCISSNNGANGVAAQGNGFVINGGQYNYNFSRLYNDGSDAGIKVITNNPTIYGNIENTEVAFNFGKGIWYDTCFENSVVSDITGNYIHDNQGAGIGLEASRNYLVANNIIVSNQADGILLNAVENAAIDNNTIIGNYGIAAIELDGGTRDQGTTYPGTTGMLNNSIQNNIISNNFTVYDLDVPTSGTGNTEIGNNTSDYNLFYRRGGALHFSTGGTYLGSWGYTPSTLATWRSKSGQDSHSLVADPLFPVPGSGATAYQLSSNSPARAAGANLILSVPGDYVGHSRAVPFDIGAFAYISAGTGTAGPVVVNSNPAVWFDDQLPSNAAMTTPDSSSNTGENRFWNWENSDVYSGAAAVDSGSASGSHREYFQGADSRLVASGDILFAYVWLDPTSLPSEIMLEWQDSNRSWAHQAYWGPNLFRAGVDGSISGHNIGGLPAAGQWVRLSVLASVVGLAGKNITGFSFDLFNGHALLDEAGTAANSTTLSGTVYRDNNGNGFLDPGEPGVGGATVYLDLNNNNVQDAGEPSSVSNALGYYAFNVAQGRYVVRQIDPPTFIASTPGGSSVLQTVDAGFPGTVNLGAFPTLFSAATDQDNFILGLSNDALRVNIWENVPEAAKPSFSILSSQLRQLTVQSGVFTSTLTCDFSNGSPLPSAGLAFDGGGRGSLVVLGSTLLGNTFTVGSGSILVNSSSFGFTNTSAVTIVGGSGADVITLSAGSPPVTFQGGAGNDLMNILSGSYTFTGDPQPATSALSVCVSAGASVGFAAGQNSSGTYSYHLAGLNLSSGATAQLARHGAGDARSLLILSSLNLGGTAAAPMGLLDLSNNDMIALNASTGSIVGALCAATQRAPGLGRPELFRQLHQQTVHTLLRWDTSADWPARSTSRTSPQMICESSTHTSATPISTVWLMDRTIAGWITEASRRRADGQTAISTTIIHSMVLTIP